MRKIMTDTQCLDPYQALLRDKRSAITLHEVVQGIIGAGSLICARIAAASAVLGAVKDGGNG